MWFRMVLTQILSSGIFERFSHFDRATEYHYLGGVLILILRVGSLIFLLMLVIDTTHSCISYTRPTLIYTRVQGQPNSKSSHLIGWERKFGPKGLILGSNFGPEEFTLRCKSKVWKHVVALIWHHFPPKVVSPPLKKILVLVWKSGL